MNQKQRLRVLHLARNARKYRVRKKNRNRMQRYYQNCGKWAQQQVGVSRMYSKAELRKMGADIFQMYGYAVGTVCQGVGEILVAAGSSLKDTYRPTT